MTVYQATLLGIEEVPVPDKGLSYYRLRLRLDNPADAPKIRYAPNQVTVEARDDAGMVLRFAGLFQIEDEAAGIIIGNFNRKQSSGT